jgi:hypothetical protein
MKGFTSTSKVLCCFGLIVLTGVLWIALPVLYIGDRQSASQFSSPRSVVTLANGEPLGWVSKCALTVSNLFSVRCAGFLLLTVMSLIACLSGQTDRRDAALAVVISLDAGMALLLVCGALMIVI